jgi:hypothetical protein
MRNNLIFLLLAFWPAALLIMASAQENQEGQCQNGCLHKIEFCDPYESKCGSCEAICLPPTNSKFKDCGKFCSNFLQDLLIKHYHHQENVDDESKKVDLETVEALLVIVTCVTILTLILVVSLIVIKFQFKNGIKAKTDILPMLQLQNSASVRTLSTCVASEETTSSIRQPQNGLQTVSSRRPRVPSEDRVPSNRNSYENPAMVPSPSHNSDSNLPPLRV